MTIISILKDISKYFSEWGILLIVGVLSVVQIAPIKIDPWSWIAEKIGNVLNKKSIKRIEEVTDTVIGQIDEVNSHVAHLEEAQNTLQSRFKEEKAGYNRNRILRFSDEIRSGVRHSEESYNQILCDINEYEEYCSKHCEYKNDRANLSISLIRDAYALRLRNNDFL